MFDYTKCLKITKHVDNNTVIIENCGNVMADLNGHYVILLEDGVPIIKDYIFTHLRRNAQHSINMMETNPGLVLKMLLSTDSEVRSNSYTELFLRDAGSIQSLINDVHARDVASLEPPVSQMSLFSDTVTKDVVEPTIAKDSYDSSVRVFDEGLVDDLPEDPFVSRVPEEPPLAPVMEEVEAISLQKPVTERVKVPTVENEYSCSKMQGKECPLSDKHVETFTPYDVSFMKNYLETFSPEELQEDIIKVMDSLRTEEDFKMITAFFLKFTDVVEV